MNNPLLDVNETARFLHLSTFEIYRLSAARKIPHYRLGTGPRPRIRFSSVEIDAWLQGQHITARDEGRRLRRRP